MRYFKIYNKNITKTQPLKELDRDAFYFDLSNYCLDEIDKDPEAYEEGFNFDEAIERLISFFEKVAALPSGLATGDYYLYIADDNKTVLDFNRKNS